MAPLTTDPLDSAEEIVFDDKKPQTLDDLEVNVIARSTSTPSPSTPSPSTPSLSPQSGRGTRFWLTILAICVSLFLSALEFTAVSTALPTIVDDLHADDFAWVGTAYALASTAFLPMSGGMAELCGRKMTMLSGIVIFALGSGLCGGAQNMNWLIAARTVQGVGGGCIQSLSSIIMGDLVPLRDRGLFNGLFGLTWAVGGAIGPVVGGTLAQQGQWRWLFYLNVPISGVSFAMVAILLRIQSPPGTVQEKLRRMDWLGNFLVIASSCAIVIGLTWGGVQYPWLSARVLVPLILGLVGLVFFFVYEATWATEPMVPFRVLSNRTSLSGYFQIFLAAYITVSIAYYIPVYFQACRGASPTTSGVDALGTVFAMTPMSIISGMSVKITQRYRPQLIGGWVMIAVGCGLLSLLRADSSLGKGIGYQFLTGIGCGIMYAVSIFPILAPLAVEDSARALAFFAFMRAFAGIWGVTVGSAALQNQLNQRLPQEFLSALPEGVAIAYSAIPNIKGLPDALRSQVEDAFARSLSVVWQIGIGAAGVGFLISLMMKGLPLHSNVDEKWAMSEAKQSGSGESKETAV